MRFDARRRKDKRHEHPGTRRTVTRFLWVPKRLGAEWRWMETATWTQTYFCMGGFGCAWVDNDYWMPTQQARTPNAAEFCAIAISLDSAQGTEEMTPEIVMSVLRVRRIPMSPAELYSELKPKHTHVTADGVQSIIWDLLNSGELRFTPDRRVTLTRTREANHEW